MPVELTWDGKYVNGKKTAPVRIPLPFQDVETVNESVHQRNLMLDLWGAGRQSEWRNRLIWGDKKYVLPSLLPEFAGKVALVYIDPPFATGADFSFTATIPGDKETNGGGRSSSSRASSSRRRIATPGGAASTATCSGSTRRSSCFTNY